MGIFSDRCEALVNPVTGRALSGKALEEAKKEPSWPRCGHSNKKSAKHCSMCGAPARGGWIKCPHCGEWVGNDSNFCWNCNTPLNPNERSAIAGGVWHRNEGVYAQRFEADALTATEGRDLQVQEGTIAILISEGAVEDVLDAGGFKVESVARKINWFGNPPNRSIILVEAGECILPLEINDLPTKAEDGSNLPNGAKVDFYGEVVIRFAGGKSAAVSFIENIMKNKRSELTFTELTQRLASLLGNVVRDVCARATLTDLLSNADIRIELRKAMTASLVEDFENAGLDLVRVSSAEFNSPAYSELVLRSAELDEKRRAAEYNAALRKFESDLALNQFKDEHALRAAKESLDMEYRKQDLERQAEWERYLEEREDETEERRRVREKAAKARAEQEREEQRARDAAEKIRRQKEEDEDRIRKWAILEEEIKHRWTQEDLQRDHDFQNEKEKLAHDEEIAAMVRRAGDAQREHNWSMMVKQLEHDNVLDRTKTEYYIEKARKLQSSQLELHGKKREFERSEAVLDAQNQVETGQIRFGAGMARRAAKHKANIVEAGDWLTLKQRKLEAKEKLLDRISSCTDEKVKALLMDEYRTKYVEGE